MVMVHHEMKQSTQKIITNEEKNVKKIEDAIMKQTITPRDIVVITTTDNKKMLAAVSRIVLRSGDTGQWDVARGIHQPHHVQLVPIGSNTVDHGKEIRNITKIAPNDKITVSLKDGRSITGVFRSYDFRVDGRVDERKHVINIIGGVEGTPDIKIFVTDIVDIRKHEPDKKLLLKPKKY